MARREGSTDSPAPRRAPAPEGPDEIAERLRRAREGLPTAARRHVARAAGLEKLSPVRQALTLFAAAVEISLLVLGLLTELPTSWLLTAAFLALPLLLHYFEKRDGKVTGPTQTARRAGDAVRAARGMARRANRGRRA